MQENVKEKMRVTKLSEEQERMLRLNEEDWNLISIAVLNEMGREGLGYDHCFLQESLRRKFEDLELAPRPINEIELAKAYGTIDDADDIVEESHLLDHIRWAKEHLDKAAPWLKEGWARIAHPPKEKQEVPKR